MIITFNDIYKKFIDQLESKKNTDIDDDDLDFLEEQNDDSKEKEIYYYDNKLTYHGLLFYLQLIPSEFLKDEINDKYNLMMFPNRITNGFIEGTEKHYKLLNEINKQLITNLNNDLFD